MQYWTAEPVAAQGPRKGEPSSASMRYGFRTQPARLVRGSSRRIMTMRFRPANIRVINRRVCCWAVIGPAVQTGPENHLGRVKPNRTEGQGERNLRFLSPLESPFFPSGRRNESEENDGGMAEERQAQGGGNDGLWTPRKTKSRFSSVPTALGNRTRRDFHIPTAPTTRPVEKWKSKGRISTFPPARFLFSSKPKPKKGGLEAGRFAPASRLILQ
jgi:hypothetical protein